MSNTDIAEKKTQYSKILSTLFCSNAIIALSILCLLNNLSLDLYTAYSLLKVVIPASFCFWFIGLIIGKILEQQNKKTVIKAMQDEQKAYEIPSIFSSEQESGEETENEEELS